jgi:1-acyl-sn-glycerol-3-phosphate acyltransferase
MTGFMGFLRDLLYGYAEVIPVNRKDGESRKQAFARALQRLKQGYILNIYPEGTRSRDGKLHEFKPGVARLHLESGAPVLPVAVKGSYELMPPGQKLKIKKTVSLIVGKPLDFEKERNIASGLDKSSQEYHQLCDGIVKQIEDEIGRLLQS